MNSQPPEKQQAMHLCFENLMEGIERNLLTKNRDRSFDFLRIPMNFACTFFIFIFEVGVLLNVLISVEKIDIAHLMAFLRVSYLIFLNYKF